MNLSIGAFWKNISIPVTHVQSIVNNVGKLL